MSNYLSTPYEITQPVTMGDVGLTRDILSSLQGKYDKAQAEIDATLSLYNTELKGLRADDNSYMAAKLKEVQANIKLSSQKNGNLAYSYNKNSILNTIKEVINDPIVESAIVAKKKVQNFITDYNKKVEKDPSLGNMANYQYALDSAGYFDYMKGTTNTIGDIQYTNFSDYNKKLSATIMDLEKAKKDQTIEIPDGMGGKIQTVISGLTPAQIRSVAEASLDQNDRKQMEIDAWASTDGFKDNSVLTTAKSLFQSKSDELSVNKIDLERKIKEGGSEKQLQTWTKELNDTINSQKSIEGVTSDIRRSSIFIQQEKVFNNFANKFGVIYTESKKIVADDIYWKNKEYNLKEAEFKYKVEKDNKDKKKEDEEGIYTITTPTPLEDEIDTIEAQMDGKIGELKTKSDFEVVAYKNKIQSLAENNNKDALELMTKYEINLKSKKEGESEEDVFKRTVLTTVTNKSPLAIIGNKNHLADLKAITDDYDMYLSATNNAISEGKAEHLKATLDNKETFSAFYKNPDTKMLWTNDKGQVVAIPVYKVLQVNGLMDAKGNKTGDLTSKKGVLKALQQSYDADEFLSTSTSEKINKKALGSLALSLGESLNSVLESYKFTVRTGEGMMEERIGYRAKAGTKTDNYLSKAASSGIRDEWAWNDQSLSTDDSTISQYTKKDYKATESYKRNLRAFADKLPENKVISVLPTNEAAYKKVAGYTTSASNVENGRFTIDVSQGINLQENGDYVQVSQSTTSAKEGTNLQKVNILKSDFYQNFPELASKINFETKAPMYTADRLEGKTLVSSSISFMTNADSKQYEWATEVLLNTQGKRESAKYLKKEDALRTLIGSSGDLIQQEPNIKNLITKAVSEAGNYSINMEVYQGFGSPKLQLKMVDISTGNIIHTISQEAVKDLDEFKKVLDNTPQIYYAKMVEDILRLQSQASSMGVIDDTFVKFAKSLEN